jgi:type II secretory pathway component GspD/PulD (secretin)
MNRLTPTFATLALLACSAAFAQTAASGARNPLDPPRSANVYRVTYTLTDTDGTRKVGVQHYSVVVTEGGRTTLKNGSKIPVATGSYSNGGQTAAGIQTQFTYLDIGTNLDVAISSPVNGAFQLKTKVEQSSIAEDKTIAGVNEPVVRQTVLEGTSVLTLGKPQVVGTLDFAGSTRHLDVEVVMEAVK